MATFADILKFQIVKSCTDLFKHYNGTVRLTSEEKVTETVTKGIVGVIAFYGPMVRGSLNIMLNEEILKGIGNSQTETSDWAAELSNQLLGRIKNSLRKYQVSLYVSPPLSMSGTNLNFKIKNKIAVRYNFELSTSSLRSTFSIVIDAKYDASWEVEETISDGMSEGDTVLF